MRRVRGSLLLIAVCSLAAANVWTGSRRPFDGTLFAPVPSRLHLPEALLAADSTEAVAAGRLLTIANGRLTGDRLGLHAALDTVPIGAVVDFAFLDAASGAIDTVLFDPDRVRAAVADLPPATLIRSVYPDLAADRAGIRAGDLLVGVDGRALDTLPRRPRGLHRIVVGLTYGAAELGELGPVYDADFRSHRGRPGDTVVWTVVRDGQEQEPLPLTLDSFTRLPGYGVLLVIAFGLMLLGSLSVRGKWWSIAVLPLASGYALTVLFRAPPARALDIVPDLSLLLAVLVPMTRFLPPLGLGIVLAVVGLGWALMPLAEASQLVQERVLERGTEAVVVTALIGCVFVFALLQLLRVHLQARRSLSPDATSNQQILSLIRNGELEAMTEAAAAAGEEGTPCYYEELALTVSVDLARDLDLNSSRSNLDDVIARDEDRWLRRLLPARWSEVALPLLGFLGTVIGIAQALPEISAVLQSTDPDQDVMGALNRAFRSLGMAFDTTFLGLAGLLVVGMFHAVVRGRVLGWLSEAAEHFHGLLADVITTSTTSQLQGLNLRLISMETELELARTHRQAIAGLLEAMVEEGAAQPWTEMRRVLTRPIVAFDRWDDTFAQALHDHEELKDSRWTIRSLAQPVRLDGVRVAIVELLGGEHRIVRFSMGAPDRVVVSKAMDSLQRVVASTSGTRVVALAADGAVHGWTPGDGDRGSVAIPFENGASEQPSDLLAANGGSHAYALLVGSNEGGISLFWGAIDTAADFERLAFPQDGTRWSAWDLHAGSGTLFMAGLKGGHWRLLQLPLRHRKPDGTEAFGIRSIDLQRLTILPAGDITAVHALSSTEAVVLDRASATFSYVGTESGIARAIDHPDWPGGSAVRLIRGRGRWVAVHDRDGARLSMWRVLRGGTIIPFAPGGRPSTYPVGDLKGDIQATEGGSHVVAAAGQGLAVWTVPRLMVEGLGGTS